jgi:hypothetical protein
MSDDSKKDAVSGFKQARDEAIEKAELLDQTIAALKKALKLVNKKEDEKPQS